MSIAATNAFIIRHIRAVELIGVVLRIVSFSLVSWLGPTSPFLFVWIINTIDAIILARCAVLKRDIAYIILNFFWIIIGIIGVLRTSSLLG